MVYAFGGTGTMVRAGGPGDLLPDSCHRVHIDGLPSYLEVQCFQNSPAFHQKGKVAEYADHMITNGPGVDFPWNVQYRIRNDSLGIALEPGESNVVDISLAIPDWITAVDVRCTMVLTKGRRGPNYLWINRCTPGYNYSTQRSIAGYVHEPYRRYAVTILAFVIMLIVSACSGRGLGNGSILWGFPKN